MEQNELADMFIGIADGTKDEMRTPLCKISSTGEIEQRFRLN